VQDTKDRVLSVVEREFAVSLQQKEQELATIDDRILQVRKYLDLVRRGTVKKYYRETQPQQTLNRPEVALHPAVKKELQGKAPRKGGEGAAVFQKERSGPLEKKEEVENSDRVVPRYIPPRQELVVGNVSRWIPEEQREGAASHKWMVYVRGGREEPDISSIVSRVQLELHPSYTPHHLVEVNQSPFHLTRRGWGEFPLHCRIFFTHPLNKPVSVTHQLRLDKTYTGLQTLGAETCLEVWLHKE